MTDTTVAPPSAAPSTSPPTNNQPSVNPSVSHEVPIDQNRVDSPAPIGPQAPPRDSARESILKAFERAQSPPPKTGRPEKPAAKAAEAKVGHNQPPEQTPPEKLDLKKRPGDQPKPRGDRGRFASRSNERTARSGGGILMRRQVRRDKPGDKCRAGRTKRDWTRSAQATAAARALRRAARRMAEHAGNGNGPSGAGEWSAAKSTACAASSVKAYQAYRGAAEAFKPIAPFHQMAQEHGTTLEQALTNYVSMEQKLREDPIAGLDVIVNNLGLTDPETGQRIGLAGYRLSRPQPVPGAADARCRRATSSRRRPADRSPASGD